MARRREKDHFTRRAQKEGYAARSVYKLQEIDQRWRLLKPGARVLDLGCSPGSWMQYAAQRVGKSGHVLGFDLKPVEISLPPWADARVGDVADIGEALAESFDVVLSDMAPATMGDHKTDAIRSAGLAEQALWIAARCLKTGGHVVVKLLEGGDVPALVQSMRGQYGKVERLRPKATRSSSTEIFLVGLHKKAAAEPSLETL